MQSNKKSDLLIHPVLIELNIDVYVHKFPNFFFVHLFGCFFWQNGTRILASNTRSKNNCFFLHPWVFLLLYLPFLLSFGSIIDFVMSAKTKILFQYTLFYSLLIMNIPCINYFYQLKYPVYKEKLY